MKEKRGREREKGKFEENDRGEQADFLEPLYDIHKRWH